MTQTIFSVTVATGELPTLRAVIASPAIILTLSACASLQATYIRNTIRRALRETHKDAPKRLAHNLVFAAPTISVLATAVYSAASANGPGTSLTPADLWKYVEQYSANFSARPKDLVIRPGGKDVVLITGTTGGFGCDTLEHLLRDETVGKVYAFNRKNTQAMERQRAQFKARGLDEALLDSPKFVMVEAVLHDKDFGLDAALLEEIRTSVSQIMLNGEIPIPTPATNV